ncbi:hypothetical protein [Halonotius sp. GCM10025705]|uniref:hypothetical protein n=1 Tax=Halonotius sp. GCM10025705 TaxID=3252678 RepID=UPI00361A3D50
MTPPGSPNPAVYRELRDVLRRQPEITETWYAPDAVQRRYLVGSVAPARVESPTGPDAPQIAVRWLSTRDEFRIDYTDPNTGFHCGWHRDDDHPGLGATHFQYKHPEDEEPTYEEADFAATTPPKLLWACLDDLFSVRLPQLTTE